MSERWTTHCPRCSGAVLVAGHPDEVACTSCGDRFPPEGLATAQYRRPHMAPDPVDPDDPLVGERLGRWRIQRLLGRGGMGRVYEATDRFRRKHVALKVLSEHLAADEAFRKRFDRESEMLAELTHPHIVRVVDRGEDEGRLWFAMDYVRGESLRRRLERGPLPAAEAVAVATQVASALSYAHERGVIHRDLKPENVLLGEDGTARLVDFGLSKWHGERAGNGATRLTHTDVIMGTYEYMAPEQRRGDGDVGPQADVFALGVILYEMLTGSLPLGRFQLPSELSVDVSRRLDTIVTRALAPDPRRRHASAEALREDLEDALRGGPEPAPVAPATPGVAPPVATDGGVLRHVEILSALDRVLGIVALLAAMGGFAFVELLTPVHLSLVPTKFIWTGSIVSIILGIFLLRQGSRLSRLTPGSRETQVTTSLVFLVFPPFLTALGIYGLWALTGDRAREAFDRRRPRLAPPFGPAAPLGVASLAHAAPVVHAARPLVPMAPTGFPSTQAIAGPSLLLRGFLLGAILWCAHSMIVGLDVIAFSRSAGENFSVGELQTWIKGTVVAGIVALGWTASLIAHRRTHRGWGLSLFALLLLLASLVVLCTAWGEASRARSQNARTRFGALPSVTASPPVEGLAPLLRAA
ncbi:MAG: serine/threonine-protein kinase [Planctomycetota bacterium]